MQNKWTATVSQEEPTEEITTPTPKKNNSKKIGIAMGIIGAILVTAGAAPMLFGNSDDLTGDITNTEEAIDPLVALLSGDRDDTTLSTPTPKITPKATPTPIKAKKIIAKSVKVTNSNIGNNDKSGTKFKNAAPLSNTSISTQTTKTKSQTANKDLPKPQTNVQTGVESNIILGLLFLIISGGLFVRSRKS